MLFACLQRHPVGLSSVGIDGHPNHATRHLAHIRLSGGKKCGMRPTVPHGHAKTLGMPNHHVGTPFPRGRHQRKCQEVWGDPGDTMSVLLSPNVSDNLHCFPRSPPFRRYGWEALPTASIVSAASWIARGRLLEYRHCRRPHLHHGCGRR